MQLRLLGDFGERQRHDVHKFEFGEASLRRLEFQTEIAPIRQQRVEAEIKIQLGLFASFRRVQGSRLDGKW
jgi:hypothetical protein